MLEPPQMLIGVLTPKMKKNLEISDIWLNLRGSIHLWNGKKWIKIGGKNAEMERN